MIIPQTIYKNFHGFQGPNSVIDGLIDRFIDRGSIGGQHSYYYYIGNTIKTHQTSIEHPSIITPTNLMDQQIVVLAVFGPRSFHTLFGRPHVIYCMLYYEPGEKMDEGGGGRVQWWAGVGGEGKTIPAP